MEGNSDSKGNNNLPFAATRPDNKLKKAALTAALLESWILNPLTAEWIPSKKNIRADWESRNILMSPAYLNETNFSL